MMTLRERGRLGNAAHARLRDERLLDYATVLASCGNKWAAAADCGISMRTATRFNRILKDKAGVDCAVNAAKSMGGMNDRKPRMFRPEERDEYRALRRKKFTPAEASAIVARHFDRTQAQAAA